MKKDYSPTAIILDIVFCACTIGINALYFKRNIPLFSAGIAVCAVMIIVNIVCLVLAIKKQNQNERYNKIITFISMLCTIIAALIPLIGVLVLMFK
ncbi:MAG: hypothetical protein K2M47_06420 [Clostridiales bacterium]|nr:hypothetical protein [Clostridiales bacterium]